MSNVGEYQCEDCGYRTDDPAVTKRYEGYRETVVIAFCEECVF